MSRKIWAFRLTNLLVVLALASVLGGCQSQTGSPAARYGARMVFDPVGNRAILFGGRAEGLFGLKYFNDLWAFDTINQKWKPIKTAKRPAARLSPGMVYDHLNDQIILFGGHNAQGRLEDTWIYSVADNRWQEVAPSDNPSPRSDMGMVYDQANNIVILFSGYCQEGDRDLCDDTWSYDPVANIWTELSPKFSPPIMYGHTLLYDNLSRQTILWGGHMSVYQNGVRSSIGYGNTLWRYDYNDNIWQEIEVRYGERPLARYWHQAAYDSTGGSLILFGGDGGNGFLADTWRFDMISNTWGRVNTEEAPPPRINAAIVFDPVNEIVVLFGGRREDRADLDDTWVFRKGDVHSEWINIMESHINQ